MIGVIADSEDQDVVREFFELFKTPWEFFRENRRYEVVLSAGTVPFDTSARLVLIYAGQKTSWDVGRKLCTSRQRGNPCVLLHQGERIPVYGNAVTFAQTERGFLSEEGSGECAAYLEQSGPGMRVRIGYDLFGEIRTLLTEGQPQEQAGNPTLELHVALLRQLITGCGISLLEIPPVPEGYQFIACLTHDVDHPSLRLHKWDHTAFGFLSRALLGSLRDLVRGRIALRGLIENWAAACKLPLVYLGLAKDFWAEFDDRYLELEKGCNSTFFVIPFKNNAGKSMPGKQSERREARYGARDIAGSLRKLAAAGCEIGLHGIDAWCDTAKGREELVEIRGLTEAPEIGVRMHWLFHNRQSLGLLEAAGASYDSTVGYNETVGYRAGTTQAFKPLEAGFLLELPMHAMDTALFYPGYLGLSQQEAAPILARLISHAVRFGGCLTFNWHDRSLSPERSWGESYRGLLDELKKQGVWFATAGQAISWFRKRRSAVFESDCSEPGTDCARLAKGRDENLPGLRLRLHKARTFGSISEQSSEDFVDIPMEESTAAAVPSEAGI